MLNMSAASISTVNNFGTCAEESNAANNSGQLKEQVHIGIAVFFLLIPHRISGLLTYTQHTHAHRHIDRLQSEC